MKKYKLILLSFAALVTVTTACKKEAAVNPDESVQAKVVIAGDKTSIELTSTDKIKESNYKDPKVWMQTGKVLSYTYNKVSDTRVNIDITTTLYQSADKAELFHKWVLTNGRVDTLKITNATVSGYVTITLR